MNRAEREDWRRFAAAAPFATMEGKPNTTIAPGMVLALLDELEREPSDADEPGWPNWFSCADCQGWFYSPPGLERNVFGDGDECCDGCARLREGPRANERMAEPALGDEVVTEQGRYIIRALSWGGRGPWFSAKPKPQHYQDPHGNAPPIEGLMLLKWDVQECAWRLA